MIRKIVKLVAEEYLTPDNIRKISNNSNVNINNRELSKQEIESLITDIKDMICDKQSINDISNNNDDNQNVNVNIRFEENKSK